MQLKPGTLLQGGKYKIVRFIKSGGFGCTYEAWNTVFEERVAIKEFFSKDFCNREDATLHVTVGTHSKKPLVDKLRNKFIDEAKAIRKLSHSGIVKVSDVFEENGTAYYVMDYIDGCSLDEIVRRDGALPEQTALGYIRQVCYALDYVHSQNRLHLDIKPGNIMVDRSGHAILIDFGTSKQYDEENGENTTTILGFTPGYAPMEQYNRGGLAHFTVPTDIYALAATLYKLMVGQTPPEANMLIKPDALALPSGLSANVSAAIRKSMLPLPEERPQTIAEFLSLLKTEFDDVSSHTEESTLCSLTATQRAEEIENGVRWMDVKEFLSEKKTVLIAARTRESNKIVKIALGVILLWTVFGISMAWALHNEDWLYAICFTWGIVLYVTPLSFIFPKWDTRNQVYDVEKLDNYHPFRVRSKGGMYGLCYYKTKRNFVIPLLEIEYDRIIKVDDFCFICRKGDRYGLYYCGRKWVLPMEYDMIEKQPDNTLKVRKGDLVYKYNAKGYRVVE